LIDLIKIEGVDTQLIYKGNTAVIQGVVFTKNGFPFSGSKIDRQFSFSKIDFQLDNYIKQNENNSLLSKEKHSFSIEQTINQATNNFSEIISMGFSSGSHEEDELNLRKKKKKNNNLTI